MGKNRKTALAMMILLLLMSSLFAGFSTEPSLCLSFADNLCIPTADYLKEYPGNPDVRMPAVRTSFAFGVDADILNAKYSFNGRDDALYLGAGFSFLNVSKSIRFGSSILKPYIGLGLLIELGYEINKTYSVALKYRMYNCNFTGSKAHFLVMEGELCGYYRFASVQAFDIALSVPLTISFKVDAVTIRAGVGISMTLDSNRLKLGGEVT